MVDLFALTHNHTGITFTHTHTHTHTHILGEGNGACDATGCKYVTWPAVYLNDPLSDTGLSPPQSNLVIGGEVSLWAEEINEHNLFMMAWPRTSAFAERMWSDATVQSIADAAPRLSRMICKMWARGTSSAPISPGSCYRW